MLTRRASHRPHIYACARGLGREDGDLSPHVSRLGVPVPLSLRTCVCRPSGSLSRDTSPHSLSVSLGSHMKGSRDPTRRAITLCGVRPGVLRLPPACRHMACAKRPSTCFLLTSCRPCLALGHGQSPRATHVSASCNFACACAALTGLRHDPRDATCPRRSNFVYCDSSSRKTKSSTRNNGPTQTEYANVRVEANRERGKRQPRAAVHEPRRKS